MRPNTIIRLLHITKHTFLIIQTNRQNTPHSHYFIKKLGTYNKKNGLIKINMKKLILVLRNGAGFDNTAYKLLKDIFYKTPSFFRRTRKKKR